MNVSNFSTQELQFLEQNFEVYDAATAKSHIDFSKLPQSQVIMIGEVHYSSCMKNLQRRLMDILFRVWGQNEKCCLLVECLPRGEKPRREKISSWKDLPETVTLEGSDCRTSLSAAEFEHLDCLFNERSDISMLQMAASKDRISKVAEIINQGFVTGEVTVNTDIIEVPESILNELKKIPHSFDHYETELRRIKDQINNFMPQQPSKPVNSSEEIEASNKELQNSIIDTIKTYPRIIAIWGAMHFYLGEGICEALGKSNISNNILIPNKKVLAQARKETDWQLGETRSRLVEIASTRSCIGIQIPVLFKKCFLKEIYGQMFSNFKRDKVFKIKFDATTLCEKFAHDSVLEVPENTTLQFSGINTLDYIKLCSNMCNIADGDEASFNTVVSAISGLIQSRGLTIQEISNKNELMIMTDRSPRRRISILSFQAFKIIVM